MSHFPSFCVDNFYKNPDSVREYALSLEFNNIGKCQGRRTNNLEEINPEFHHNFCRKLLSFFYDLEKNQVKYDIKSYFHINYKTENERFNDLTEDSVILAHKYKEYRCQYEAGGPSAGTPVHLDDNSFASGVVYLNPLEELHAGSAIYRVVEKTEPVYNTNDRYREHVKMTANFKQIYNRLVVFDGQAYHGRTGDNTQSERLTHVFFINGLWANTPTPLNRFKV